MTTTIPLLKRPLDILFILYFLLHIPITLIVDTQCIFPSTLFPAWAQQLTHDWIRDYDDQLVATKPIWFQSFIWAELIFHIPYFFVAIYAFTKGQLTVKHTVCQHEHQQ